MKSLVIHDGPPHVALALTSLVTGLQKEYGPHEIIWVTSRENSAFYKHAQGVDVRLINDPIPEQDYDLLVNYGGSTDAVLKSASVKAHKRLGFGVEASPFSVIGDGERFLEAAYALLYGEDKRWAPSKQNLFQVLFQIADLTWRGEGYAFRYFPKAREKENMTGVAVREPGVRQFLKANLNVGRKLWHIPIRQDHVKQFDEVNKCENIITDDPFVMHVSLCLRKHVEFLAYEPPAYRLEFFGKGFCHLVPDEIRGATQVIA